MHCQILRLTSLLLLVGFCVAQVKYGVPRNCPPNETYFSCGDSCQTECATLGQPCLIRHIRCPDGCYCNRGFARNASGTCIPISKCGNTRNTY